MDNQEENADRNDLDQSQQQVDQMSISSNNNSIHEVCGSPGSHTNSSSSRQPRIVELLPDNDTNDDRPADWVIGADFYREDVAQNTSNLSADETDDSEERLGLESDEDDDINNDLFAEGFVLADDDDDEEDEMGMDDFMGDFVMAPGDDEQSTTSESDDPDEDANYDTTLPVGHRYLGEDLEESRGRRVIVENSTTSLPLINLKHVVLFPGQVLPITTANLNPRIPMYLKACIQRSSLTIGLISEPHTNSIGTTAEIRNYSVVQEDDKMSLIMQGCQRFILLSPPFETAIEGQIRILPEVSLGCPYPMISSLLRFRTNNDMPNKFIISKHPHWLLKRHEARNVMSRIMEQIKYWCSADLTKDPNDFSYWLAANLPISNGERLKALSFGCTEARLLWLLEMLERSKFFGCSACKSEICSTEDVFLMSQSGPQCSFVNPGGFVHDTLTVRNAQGLIQDYNWSDEFSWFPGYVWRMAHCENCHRHIGWCYKRIEPDLKPRRFFGLSRNNVRLLERSH